MRDETPPKLHSSDKLIGSCPIICVVGSESPGSETVTLRKRESRFMQEASLSSLCSFLTLLDEFLDHNVPLETPTTVLDSLGLINPAASGILHVQLLSQLIPHLGASLQRHNLTIKYSQQEPGPCLALHVESKPMTKKEICALALEIEQEISQISLQSLAQQLQKIAEHSLLACQQQIVSRCNLSLTEEGIQEIKDYKIQPTCSWDPSIGITLQVTSKKIYLN